MGCMLKLCAAATVCAEISRVLSRKFCLEENLLTLCMDHVALKGEKMYPSHMELEDRCTKTCKSHISCSNRFSWSRYDV